MTQEQEGHAQQKQGGTHAIHPMHYIVGVIVLIAIGVGVWAFVLLQNGIRSTEVATEEVPQPVVYSEEELRAIMETPLPEDSVVTYEPAELREAMDMPLPPEEVVIYSEEELRSAMEGGQ